MSTPTKTSKAGRKRTSKVRRGLNPKQALFVQHYLIELNATAAARLAGYKHPNQQGPRLLLNVGVAAAIAQGRARVTKKLECTLDDIAREMHKLGFANMADYMRTGPDGDPYLDFSQLSRDQAAALTEVTVEDFKDGRGEDARDIRRVKFKLADKRASLVDLAKLLGHMPDRHEHTGKDGGPIAHDHGWDLTKLSDKELDALDRIRARADLGHTNGQVLTNGAGDPA